MISMSPTLKAGILNQVFRGAQMKAVEKVYLGLIRPASEGNGMVEIQGGGYRRQALDFGEPDETAVLRNSGDVVFPMAQDNWGSVERFGIFTAEEGGDFLCTGEISSEAFVGKGTVYKFRAGDLVLDFQES